jgi:enamine deaminase RidA (YjgF/YER057c/UK114 family)
LNDCLKGLAEHLRDRNLDPGCLLKQTCFLRAEPKASFAGIKQHLMPLLTDFSGGDPPPTAFVGQPPGNGAGIALEAWMVSDPAQVRITDAHAECIRYRIVEGPAGREVFASVAGTDAPRDPADQAETAFSRMTSVLRDQGLDFADVVRQWNYIERIVDVRSSGKNTRQNYQAFNDVRSRYYRPADFKHGYPAATGIGMNHGSVVIECLAFKPGHGGLRILPVSNPRQTDAHRYSQDVLRGTALAGMKQKGTPKFERAKLLAEGNRALIFISGTAAILGQATISRDAEGQTHTTLDNIERLISRTNLNDNGYEAGESGRIEYMRIYVKRSADVPRVREICRQRHSKVPALYVISDICRPDLLVEIEGIARLSP